MIVGAGLAGLIAAHKFPNHAIVEARAEERIGAHKAVLRFRSDVVGQITGVEFTPVRVHKGIWHKGAWTQPTIQVANLYSRKVTGQLLDRSIWNLDSVVRWIAPPNFYERLVDHCWSRIQWETQADFTAGDSETIISTAPMHIALQALGIDPPGDFKRAPIAVKRYTLDGASVYQTVYFPSSTHSLYRASITGDLLICEFAGGKPHGEWVDELTEAFGIHILEMCPLDDVQQDYGKIAPIHDGRRKRAIAELTTDHNVFSLGRFATWRNILLDDVVKDIDKIKRLIPASPYERMLAASA